MTCGGGLLKFPPWSSWLRPPDIPENTLLSESHRKEVPVPPDGLLSQHMELVLVQGAL